MNTAKDFGAPLLLLLIGVLGKWIVRRNWNMALLFMGPDLVLAGLGSDLAHLLDFGSAFLPGSAPLEQGELRHAGLGLLFTGLYILGALGFYLVVLIIHQSVESAPAPGAPTPPSGLKQFIWLVVVSNFIGVVTMAAVVFMLRSL